MDRAGRRRGSDLSTAAPEPPQADAADEAPAGRPRAVWNRLTSRRVLDAAGVAVLATTLSFPVRSTRPGLGLDSSWQLGLSLAHTQDLQFGPDLVFTYGPLGFLAVPQDVFLIGAVLGTAYAAITAFALFSLLFVAARRWLPAPAAVLLVLAFSLVTPFVSIPEQGVLAVTLVALRLLEPDRRPFPLPCAGAVLLGLLAAGQLLVKSSSGGVFLGVALLVAAVRPGRATRAPTVVVSFGLGLAALWLLSGQQLSELVGWARAAAAVASGYGDAMALWGLPEAWLPLVGLLALLAWRIVALAEDDLSGRWPQVLLLVATSWFFLKAGFVRMDTGHVVITLVGLAGLLVWFHWTGWLRAVGVGAALVAVPWMLVIPARGPESSIPDAAHEIAEGHLDGAQAVAGVAHQVLDRDEHRGRLEQARQDAAAFYEVGPEVVEALAGGTVAADPWDVAAVWGNDLTWQPLPVFQAYSVYEPRLDDLNAELVRADDGPDGILRATGRIDGRFQPWEPPRTQVEVACRYRVAAEDGRWQALVRTDAECGTAHELATVDAAAGEAVTVPEASDGDHLVVATFSDPRAAIDMMADVVFKPFGESVVEIDGVPHRWTAATAGQPHLLRVPAAIDGEALPDAGLAVDELAFADAVRITFSEVPVVTSSP